MTILSLAVMCGTAAVATAQGFQPFQEVCNGAGAGSSVCQTTGNDPITGAEQEGILVKVVRIISYITGIAAVIMVIVGGLSFILSNGDSSRVATARNTVLYAVIGVIITVVAQALVLFVLKDL